MLHVLRLVFKITEVFTEFIQHKGETAAWDLNQEKQPSEVWWLADTS